MNDKKKATHVLGLNYNIGSFLRESASWIKEAILSYEKNLKKNNADKIDEEIEWVFAAFKKNYDVVEKITALSYWYFTRNINSLIRIFSKTVTIESTLEQAYNRYIDNEPLFIFSGWKRHSITLVAYKNYLIVGDRSGKVTQEKDGITIYKLNEKLKKEDYLFFSHDGAFELRLQDVLSKIEKITNNETIKVEGGEVGSAHKFMASLQKYGTCGYANKKAALKGLLILRKQEKINKSIVTKITKNVFDSANSEYKKFTIASRINLLTKIIEKANSNLEIGKGSKDELEELTLWIIHHHDPAKKYEMNALNMISKHKDLKEKIEKNLLEKIIKDDSYHALNGLYLLEIMGQKGHENLPVTDKMHHDLNLIEKAYEYLKKKGKIPCKTKEGFLCKYFFSLNRMLKKKSPDRKYLKNKISDYIKKENSVRSLFRYFKSTDDCYRKTGKLSISAIYNLANIRAIDANYTGWPVGIESDEGSSNFLKNLFHKLTFNIFRKDNSNSNNSPEGQNIISHVIKNYKIYLNYYCKNLSKPLDQVEKNITKIVLQLIDNLDDDMKEKASKKALQLAKDSKAGGIFNRLKKQIGKNNPSKGKNNSSERKNCKSFASRHLQKNNSINFHQQGKKHTFNSNEIKNISKRQSSI